MNAFEASHSTADAGTGHSVTREIDDATCVEIESQCTCCWGAGYAGGALCENTLVKLVPLLHQRACTSDKVNCKLPVGMYWVRSARRS